MSVYKILIYFKTRIGGWNPQNLECRMLESLEARILRGLCTVGDVEDPSADLLPPRDDEEADGREEIRFIQLGKMFSNVVFIM